MRTILVSAYACEPLKGSEQGVGWNWVLQMAKFNSLHVITRANNRETIEHHLPKDLAPNISFHYYDTPPIFRRFKNKAKGLYFYYFFWQLGIIPTLRKLVKEHAFEYSVHLTFGSIWMPTFLPFFDVPFIWGPIGGGEGEPYTFLNLLPLKQRAIQYARLFMKKISILNPAILFISYKSKIILVRTENSAAAVPKAFGSKVRIILETAIEPEIFNLSNENLMKYNRETRIITTGRLMPSKNLICAIRSLLYVPDKYNIKYKIIGSGPEEKKIEEEIRKFQLQNRVEIIPEVPRSELLNELSHSEIFLFPSLREGGSWSLMEAMAVGLPAICLKWSGMEIITDDDSAIRLPVTNPEQMAIDMAEAICKLIDNPELRKKMGMAGRSRIKNEFNWDTKGEFMEKLFDELDKKCNKKNYLTK